MAEVYGKKIICDRCDFSMFMANGGYQSTVPSGWTQLDLPFHDDIHLLCPRCSEVLEKILDRYINLCKLPEEANDD